MGRKIGDKTEFPAPNGMMSFEMLEMRFED
jgi:hypothetical protein